PLLLRFARVAIACLLPVYLSGARLYRGSGPDAASATRRTRALDARSSSSTGSPLGPDSGSIQFGYSVEVPGMFCDRVSPAASARLTPIISAGVSARYPYRAAVNSSADGRRPAGSSPWPTSAAIQSSTILAASA